MSKICMGCMESYEDEFDICPSCGYVEGTKASEALHMEPGSILRERYIVGKVLGFGGFGVTYIGWDALLEQKVAIKEYLPSEFSTRVPGQTQVTIFNGAKQEQFEDGLNKFVEESQRLAKFHSLEGIVKIFDSFSENNTAYIIMEYLDGETLSKFLEREKTVSPDKAIELLMPIINSLKIVHEQGIIHRDIAPDNIFLTNDGKVKLIDFGAARYSTTSHSRSLTVIIKPGYSPEEQYRSLGEQGSYTDVYALAATLYKMVTGITPPDAMERRAFFESKQKDILKPIPKYCKDITENQETAILNALNIQIEDRTPDTSTFLYELTTNESVKQIRGKIKRIDLYRWPLLAKIGVPIAATAIIIFSILFATGVIGFDSGLQPDIIIPEGMTRVPSVINNNLSNAERRLTDVTLGYSITGKEYSNEIEINYVLNQEIDAGTIVKINTILNIVVSGGVETKTVPNVEGFTIENAKKSLEDLGFIVQIEEQYSPVDKNTVISQSVQSGGEYEVGKEIKLVVSMGVDPSTVIEEKSVIMPDFVNKEYNDVLAQADKLGLVLTISKEYNANVEKDRIISQNITAGDEMMSGSTVEIVVSLGIEMITVKDVQFRTESEAKSILEGQGLIVKISYENSDIVANGVVIRQIPATGNSVSPGTEIDITVSLGKKEELTTQPPTSKVPIITQAQTLLPATTETLQPKTKLPVIAVAPTTETSTTQEPTTAENNSIDLVSITANGSDTTPTTQLTITLNRAVPGLSASDFTVTGATKGTLTGSGPSYYLTISNITVNDGGSVTVNISKSGFTFAPPSQNVRIYNPGYQFLSLTANGSSGSYNSYSSTTTQLTLTFDRIVPNLNINDITVTGATKGYLTNSGSTYYLTLTDIQVQSGQSITVSLYKQGYIFNPSSRQVTVYKQPIQFTLSANGSDSASTTYLTLTFDKPVPGLSASDITVTGATRGSLGQTTANPNMYILNISNITVADYQYVSVQISKTGYEFGPANPASVQVRVLPNVNILSVTANGGYYSETTSQIVITLDREIAGLNPNDIVIDVPTGRSVNSVVKGTSLTRGSSTAYQYILPITFVPASTNGVTNPIRDGDVLLVRIVKTGYNFIPTEGRYVTVYNPDVIAVNFTSITANGSDSSNTTYLTLTFDRAIPGLSAGDITVTGATKGTLGQTTANPNVYLLNISNITVADKQYISVQISKSGYELSPTSASVQVRILPTSNVYELTDSNYVIVLDSSSATNMIYGGNVYNNVVQLTVYDPNINAKRYIYVTGINGINNLSNASAGLAGLDAVLGGNGLIYEGVSLILKTGIDDIIYTETYTAG